MKDINVYGGYIEIGSVKAWGIDDKPIIIREIQKISKAMGEEANRRFKMLSHGKQNRLLRRVKR
jgi:hypothetical protein